MLTNISDESDDNDDDSNWQTVAMKRKNSGSPKIFRQKRPHHDADTSTSNNRFNSLATDVLEEDDNEKATDAPEEAKTPPIFIPDVDNIGKMVTSISKIIDKNHFSFKSLRDGQVRLVIKTVESYRKVVKFLETTKKAFHTYQLKQERAHRVVIKGLHHSTPISDIKADLLLLGHQVRSVRNVISRVTKNPLPMFFVDLDPNPNNNEIYKLRSFNNAIIQVEPPKHFDEIVQCHRCQEYGHTKSYCKKSFRCVKCGLGHATTECPKSRDALPKCVHCLESHTANYRGCRVYQNIISKRTKGENRRSNAQAVYNAADNNNYQHQNSFNMSYSEAVRGVEPNQTNILQKIESMLNKQIELINTLVNMMSMMMNKLCN